jgi:hypothetical protein
VTFSNEDPLSHSDYGPLQALKHVFADIAKPGALVFVHPTGVENGIVTYWDLLVFL